MRSFLIKPLEEAPEKIGRNNGKQAPTIPKDDSIIGQYTVGVKVYDTSNETLALLATLIKKTSFAIPAPTVNSPSRNMALTPSLCLNFICKAQMQGRGMARIAKSVKTSDHDWESIIMFVLMQRSFENPHHVQFVAIGQHWNKLEKK